MATAIDVRPSDGALARAVHDMRGPLTVIRGMCEVLGRQVDPECDTGRGLCAIEAETVRLAAALDALLVPSLDDGSQADLAAVVAAAAERHRWAAHARELRLQVRCTANPEVPLDARQLARVVDNLLRNALDHSPCGGRVRLLVGVRERWAHLRVCDDGPGVAERDRDRIFLAGNRGAQPPAPGRGLGLAIARDLVGVAGGVIGVERGRGGACFRVVLPIVNDRTDSSGAADGEAA